MKAVGVFEFGGPDVLTMFDLSEEHAGVGEVRVRVHAATVNPTDTGLRAGQRKLELPPPYVPGVDVAGTIDEIGIDTDTDLQVGDSVMAMVVPNGTHGGYRETIVLRADAVARAPRGTSHYEAATLPMNGLTARQGLDQLRLRPGQTLAVTGAAGCYGGYVVQLAKAAGLQVVADASESDAELVRSLGADVVLPRGQDFAEHVRAAIPEGVDGLADGAIQSERALGAVRDGGGFVTVRGWQGPAERGITIHATAVRNYDHRADLLEELRALAESGELTMRVDSVFEADQAPEAHRRIEAGGVRGRMVLQF